MRQEGLVEGTNSVSLTCYKHEPYVFPFVFKCSQMALFLQHPLQVCAVQPKSPMFSPSWFILGPFRQPQTSLACWSFVFLEDPPPSVPSKIRMVCMGSGSVARIILNICDQAQNNCIMKRMSTGGARRQKKPQFLKKMDRK